MLEKLLLLLRGRIEWGYLFRGLAIIEFEIWIGGFNQGNFAGCCVAAWGFLDEKNVSNE